IDGDQLRRTRDVGLPLTIQRLVVVAVAGPDILNAVLRQSGGRFCPTAAGAVLPVVDVIQLWIAGAGEDVDVLGIRDQQIADPAAERAPVFHVLAASPVGVAARGRQGE